MMNSRLRILIFAVVFSFLAGSAWADGNVWIWHRIPHVAAGGTNPSYTSFLTIREPNGQARQIYIYFYDDNGQPLTLLVGGVSYSTFNFQIGANEERSWVLTGGSNLLVGQIQIASQGVGGINASLRYATSDNSGNLIDAVAVLPAVPNYNWSLTVEKRRSSDDTGVAIANPFNTTSPINVTFDLFQNGARVAGTSTVTRSIQPLGHMATFISQLFPGVVFSGIGTLKISCATTSVSAVALRADASYSQYSSLPADSGMQYWSVTLAGVSGTETWSWRFIDGFTFLGAGTNPDNVDKFFGLRGVVASDLTPQYFLCEWNYTSTDGTQGVMIYQGVPSTSGGTSTITGKRVQMKSDGTIVGTTTFTATRIS
jgi:hypothetical protein